MCRISAVSRGLVLSSSRVFAIPGICALLIFILARPQEYFESLQKLPLLYLFCGMAIGGFILDLKLRRLQPVLVPTSRWILAFATWTVVCNIVKVPDQVVKLLIEMGILLVMFFTIAHACQRFRTFQIVTGTLVGTVLVLSFICWHQGFQPQQCILSDDTIPGEGRADGRFCEVSDTCYTGEGVVPGGEYTCERAGLLGTSTVEDRVRYRGELYDPNELCMTICVFGFSFVIAFMMRKRTTASMIMGTLGVVLVLWTVLLTQSRGGLIVALMIPGVYFVKKFGVKGFVGAAAMAMPMMALAGGRNGADADLSTQLRYEAWGVGLQIFKASPIFGVGQRQFSEYNDLTAHNSYVLTLAELGFIGQFIFMCIIVLSVKSLVVGMKELENVPEATVARVWGMALLASFCGMIFQIYTLSFAYHSVLWIMLGLTGAWTSSVRFHKPNWDIKLRPRDMMYIVCGQLFYDFLFLPVFLKMKGAT